MSSRQCIPIGKLFPCLLIVGHWIHTISCSVWNAKQGVNCDHDRYVLRLQFIGASRSSSGMEYPDSLCVGKRGPLREECRVRVKPAGTWTIVYIRMLRPYVFRGKASYCFCDQFIIFHIHDVATEKELCIDPTILVQEDFIKN